MSGSVGTGSFSFLTWITRMRLDSVISLPDTPVQVRVTHLSFKRKESRRLGSYCNSGF